MERSIQREIDGPEFARGTRRFMDKDGMTIGKASDKPILDTHIYEVEYRDGHKTSLHANEPAKNKFHQGDGEENLHVLSEEIIDHKNYVSEVK